MKAEQILSALAVAGLLAFGACSDDDDDGGDGQGAASTTTSTSTTVATGTSDTTTPDGPQGTAPLPRQGQALSDGRHAVYLEAVDVDEDTLGADVMQWLEGD